MQEERRSNKAQRNDDFYSLGSSPGKKKIVVAFIVWQAIIGSAGLRIPMINRVAGG